MSEPEKANQNEENQNGENQNEENQNEEKRNGEVYGGRKHITNRHKYTKKNKHSTVIIGKVYADWCGHCQTLKPEWKKMKTHVKMKNRKHNVVFTEIEEKQIDTKLRKLEEQHRVKVEANGYPTLFKISDGKVTYYSGNRTSDAMSNWVLKGGEPPLAQEMQMPNLMADVQGGRRWHSTRKLGRHKLGRHKFNNSRRYKENYNYEKQQRHTKSKRTGLFDFLFGK
jgi:thiol-disulfide isomerase/thioredoxin